MGDKYDLKFQRTKDGMILLDEQSMQENSDGTRSISEPEPYYGNVGLILIVVMVLGSILAFVNLIILFIKAGITNS